MAIKGVVFDLDGVYFLNGKANFISSISSRFSVPESDVKKVFLDSREMNELYKTGKMSGEDFWSFAARAWRIKASPAELVSLLVSGYEVNERARRLCRLLRAAGYRTLVCSNNFEERLAGLERRFGFYLDFDAIVSSHQVGALKPDPRIFAELCSRARLSPPEIFIADDREGNCLAARKFGMLAVHYSDFDGFVRNLREAGVQVPPG